MLDAAESYRALREEVVGRVVRSDLVSVTGPDARSYLQGQCTQDLSGLPPGESTESLLLSPQGRLDAYLRISCRSAEAFDLLVAPGFGALVLERLRRFKLRVKADLAAGEVPLVELRGPAAGTHATAAGALGALVVEWPGLVGLDLPGVAELPSGVAEGDPEAFAAARIEAGQPEMGAELSERTIPQEAGIVARTVSFTKGCFTGQELVARLDARGNNVVRNLRGIVLPEGAVASLGDTLVLEERELGELTSLAYSPGLGRVVALSLVRREVKPPATVALASGAGPSLEVEVRELPLYRPALV
jgi:folate-binding protein YgfZ